MSRTPHRMPTGGRIDRSKPLRFLLDGRPMSGFQGDTLASALLGNRASLVGRSFKYHRPRGFLTAGVDEPNGLFTLGEAGSTEPNIPGTTVELLEGLTARSQNAWPSVRFDLRAVHGLLAPLLGAGFYYKTFMGPTHGAWMFYEPFIRRAAGLGFATHERDPDRYESRHLFADVLVIGGGPAGLAAAVAAGRSGARVVLAEQDSLLGGALLREPSEGAAELARQALESELTVRSNVEILRRTTAFGVYDGNTVALAQRHDHLCPVAAKGESRLTIATLRSRAIVFATGATERPLIFPNNDRPGVMLASAARSYLNRFAVIVGKRVVVATNNSSAYEAALDLAKGGASVTIADHRAQIDPLLREQAASLSIEVIPSASIRDLRGGRRVTSVMLATGRGELHHRECDLLCMSGGWSPTVHLTSHGGSKPRYRLDIGAFVPAPFATSQFGAGALTGDFSFSTAIRTGLQAGQAAAACAGYTSPEVKLSLDLPEPVRYSIEPTWKVLEERTNKAFVDFQNDVTVKDIVTAHQEGYQSVEHLKRYTTLGMGTDQGKTSNVAALEMMAALRGINIAEAGTTTFRPPFTPVSIGALAGRSVGKLFRPIRRSPLHDWHLAHGGEMTEAGPWMRVWYYRWAGPTVERAYVEEMRRVRTAVGLADISTLGKIDVQGPDAAELLDRVYVNGFANLPIGKGRYGVMLTDDGLVLDDGTTTRLSETRYFLTTTTAQAAEVLSWLEFLLQTAWLDLEVHVTSVTDEWAGMAVAGPRARAALELALPGQDVSDSSLPHMGCREIELDGVPLRLVRLSFSGELAFEVYVPADHAVALWERILSSAAPLGIQPYGLEALAALRIEKGHVAGPELDHRNTLTDLGLGKMASTRKPFVGRELAKRSQLQAADRWSLIGIECRDSGQQLRGGAILFAATDTIAGHGRGYITSVTWSAELGRFIALGLYQGGLKHVGAEIVCAFPLKNEQVRARIVPPIFIDTRGERLRV